jgi:hypothetical protein
LFASVCSPVREASTSARIGGHRRRYRKIAAGQICSHSRLAQKTLFAAHIFMFPLMKTLKISPLLAFFFALHAGALAQVLAPDEPPAVDYPAGAQIPNAPNAPTGKNFAPVARAWSKRVIVDAYQRIHPGETTNLPFVRDAAAYLNGATERDRIELEGRANQLIAAPGSDDPMVRFLSGLVSINVSLKEDNFRRAMAGLRGSKYHPFLLFVAAANLGKSLQDRKAEGREIAAADQVALEALEKGLDAESFHGEEMSVLRCRLEAPSGENLFRRQPERLIDIFGKARALPEWIREFAQGRGYLAAAWAARTDGFASEVTEAGWRGWERNLAAARQHFTRSWELNPRDPAAATYMIEVAMGDHGGKADIRAWFDRAVAAQMDYFDAYRSFIWALRPRWHGSHEEMLMFGDELLQTGRFDTCVPFYYFKIVADIASEESDPKAIYERPEIAGNLKLVLDTYLATRDSPVSVSYAHTVSAILDFKAGNLAGAKSHMAAIQFKPDQNVDAGLKEDLSKMMQSIASASAGTAHGAATSVSSKF